MHNCSRSQTSLQLLLYVLHALAGYADFCLDPGTSVAQLGRELCQYSIAAATAHCRTPQTMLIRCCPVVELEAHMSCMRN